MAREIVDQTGWEAHRLMLENDEARNALADQLVVLSRRLRLAAPAKVSFWKETTAEVLPTDSNQPPMLFDAVTSKVTVTIEWE